MGGFYWKASISSQKERSQITNGQKKRRERIGIWFIFFVLFVWGFYCWFGFFFFFGGGVGFGFGGFFCGAFVVVFYIEWTSGKLKTFFICCLYMPPVFWQTALQDMCRSANDGRVTSRSCNVSRVWLSNIPRMTEVHQCVSKNLKRLVWEVCCCDFRFIWKVITLNACCFSFHQVNTKQHLLKQEKEKLDSLAKLVSFSYWYLTDLVSEDRF